MGNAAERGGNVGVDGNRDLVAVTVRSDLKIGICGIADLALSASIGLEIVLGHRFHLGVAQASFGHGPRRRESCGIERVGSCLGCIESAKPVDGEPHEHDDRNKKQREQDGNIAVTVCQEVPCVSALNPIDHIA